MSMFGDEREPMNEMYDLLQRRMEEVGVSQALKEAHEVLATLCEYDVPRQLRKGGKP